MGGVVKNSLHTDSEDSIFYSDCTSLSLPLQCYRVRHAVLGAHKNYAQLQVLT